MSFIPFTTSFSSDGYLPYFNADAYGEHVLTSSPSLSWNKTSNVLNVSGTLTSNAPPVAATVTQTFTANPSTTTSSWTTISSVMSNWPYGMDCSTDGRYIITTSANGSSGTIAVSRDYGTTWSLYIPAGTGASWRSTACSGDGSFMIAVGTSICYTSIDYGVTWTSRTPGGGVSAWNDCDCSDDGYAVIVNTTYNTTFCQVSSDYGVTWASKTMGAAGGYTNAVAISSLGFGTTGPVIAIGAQAKIWRSKNGGNTWGSYTVPTGSGNDRCITMDYDGSHIAYGVNSSNAWYLSTNSGDNWTQKSGPVSNTFGISMDAYGTRMLIGDYGTNLYISTDGGSTWANTGAPVTGNWEPIVISKDGYMIAATRNINGTDIYLYREPLKWAVGNSGLANHEFSYGATLSDTLTNIVTAFNSKGANTTATKTSGTTIVYAANTAGSVGNTYGAAHGTDANNVYSFNGTTFTGGLDVTGVVSSTGDIALVPGAGGMVGVSTGLSIGNTYYGTHPPTDGLAVLGKVGIGTASPTGKLEIVNTSGSTTPSNYLRLTGSTTDNSNYCGMDFKCGTYPTSYANIAVSNGGLELALVGGYSATYLNQMKIRISSNSSGNAYTDFAVGSTSILRCFDSGTTGVGYTSAPGAKLAINGTVSIGTTSDQGYQLNIYKGSEGNFLWINNQGNDRFSIVTMTSPGNLVSLGTPSNFGIMLKAGNSRLGIAASNLQPANMLSVNAGASIGSSYYATTAPTNGLIVEGQVGIGTNAPAFPLDVLGTFAIVGSNVKTTATNKNTRFGCLHYTSAEEPVLCIMGASSATTNTIDIGGGTTAGNCATEIKFNTAANTTTTGPSIRMYIKDDGYVGIGTIYPNALLTVNGVISIQEQASAPSPDHDGYGKVYAKTDGKLYFKSGQGAHTEYDLTAASSAVTATEGADGYVAFFTGSNAIAGDNDLFWDRANNRVGMGTISPATKLHISGDQGGGTELTLQGLGAGSAWADIAFLNENGDYMGDIGLSMGSDTNFYVSNQNNNTGFYTFYTKTGGSVVPRLRITNDGYVGIGTTSPVSKLDVAGDLNVSGNITNVALKTALDGYAGGGGYQTGPWEQDSVAANQSAVALYLTGSAVRTERIQIKSGSVTGIVVYSNAARTAGTLTAEVTINGSGTGLTAVLDGDNTTVKVTTQAKLTDTFAAGDRIGVALTTDSSWAPTTADITVEVLLEA